MKTSSLKAADSVQDAVKTDPISERCERDSGWPPPAIVDIEPVSACLSPCHS